MACGWQPPTISQHSKAIDGDRSLEQAGPSSHAPSAIPVAWHEAAAWSSQ